MAIKSLEQRKRQQVLLIVALAILLVAVLILYFGFWKKGGNVSEEAFPPAETKGKAGQQRRSLILENKLKKIDLDFNFLNQTILPFLKSHGQLPIEKGETGRDNPFIPY